MCTHTHIDPLCTPLCACRAPYMHPYVCIDPLCASLCVCRPPTRTPMYVYTPYVYPMRTARIDQSADSNEPAVTNNTTLAFLKLITI